MKEYRMTAAGAPEKDQSMIFDFVHRTDPLSEKKTQALNAKVAAMVALDLQPYSFVEDRGFKELMAEAVPNYRLPSRTTLSRTLVPRLFDDTRKKVKDELSSAFEGGNICSHLYQRHVDITRQRELCELHLPPSHSKF
ncbi:hypothetical protein MRX96_036061 [Rhipicephalus microplus]